MHWAAADPRAHLALAVVVLLSALLALQPATAHAFRATYEGVLVSDETGDAPIPVTLTMDVSLGVAKGEVETRSPLIGRGSMEGMERFGTCEVHGSIGLATTLRMRGTCGVSDAIFEGTYRIRVRDRPYQSGIFRLSRTGSGSAAKPLQGDAPGSGWSSGGSVTRCLETNRTCLVGCRSPDYNEALLCTNRCRRILNKCKASVSGAGAY
ncbi:MAG: hypothetical protein KIS79_05355 [Burkholderiales bacterium]|nr:hypothetical protein [Burkholderiales bacterium]